MDLCTGRSLQLGDFQVRSNNQQHSNAIFLFLVLFVSVCHQAKFVNFASVLIHCLKYWLIYCFSFFFSTRRVGKLEKSSMFIAVQRYVVVVVKNCGLFPLSFDISLNFFEYSLKDKRPFWLMLPDCSRCVVQTIMRSNGFSKTWEN